MTSELAAQQVERSSRKIGRCGLVHLARFVRRDPTNEMAVPPPDFGARSRVPLCPGTVLQHEVEVYVSR
jgi:hypothetical protein